MRKNMLITAALMAFSCPLMAQSYDDLAQVDVLTGWREDANTHVAALQITLAPGWVTYWRAPGDAGIPPEFFFSGSDAINSITPLWPTPSVFGTDGMRSVGYYNQVTVPLVIDLADPSSDVVLRGEMLIGVCEEICIPATLSFDTILPMVGAPDTEIRTALADRPATAQEAQVGTVSCAVDPIADGLRMTTQINVAPTGSSEHVVVETADPSVWVSEAETTRQGGILQATVEMVHPSGGPFAFDRSGIRITVLGSDQAVDIRGCSAG